METKYLNKNLAELQKKFLDQITNPQGLEYVNWFLNLSLEEQKQKLEDHHCIKTLDFFSSERFDVVGGMSSLSTFLSAIGDTFSVLTLLAAPYWCEEKNMGNDKKLYDEENRFCHWDVESQAQETARFIYDLVLKDYKEKSCVFFVGKNPEFKNSIYTLLVQWNQEKGKWSLQFGVLGTISLPKIVHMNNAYHYR